MISPQSIDHLVFRVSDLGRTEQFYSAFLGPAAHTSEDFVIFLVGGTRFFFTPTSEPASGPYEKDNAGLNHLAFFIPTLAQLQEVGEQLDENKIAHSGIRLDVHGQKDYIWLDDPDGMRVEFYLREDV
jgi:catechol-2,3-dioxygenase